MLIKFAGLLNKWDFASAKQYADFLHEMGFYAKAILVGDVFVVAYSYKLFTKTDCQSAFSIILLGPYPCGGGKLNLFSFEDKKD